jgi:hypothetical protein
MLFSQLPRLREPGALQAWLITVAVRKSLRWKREQQRWAGNEVTEEWTVSVPEEAVANYKEAESFFATAGEETEIARTLSISLQALIFMGQVERAFEAVSRARGIFEKHGKRLRLARLDNNLGNILYWLDRTEESLGAYLRA